MSWSQTEVHLPAVRILKQEKKTAHYWHARFGYQGYGDEMRVCMASVPIKVTAEEPDIDLLPATFRVHQLREVRACLDEAEKWVREKQAERHKPAFDSPFEGQIS